MKKEKEVEWFYKVSNNDMVILWGRVEIGKASEESLGHTCSVDGHKFWRIRWTCAIVQVTKEETEGSDKYDLNHTYGDEEPGPECWFF